MSGPFSEAQIAELWWGLASRDDLVTVDGSPVSIVYPGRPNDDRGADVRDAVIAVGQDLLRGDVEIHVRSGYWQSHRHHLDTAYNRVVLHVVWEHDSASATVLENGNAVPTLALVSFILPPVTRRDKSRHSIPIPTCPGAVRRQGHHLAGEILDRAGDARFRDRVTRYHHELRQDGAGQVLYRGMLEALGYARNRKPMLELANRLPLKRLEGAVPGRSTPEESLLIYRTWLLGAAGLLPPQDSPVALHNCLRNQRASRLMGEWFECRLVVPMSRSDWVFYKIRPANRPDRRLVAMSHLLVRYREAGFLEDILNIVRESPVENGYLQLERALIVDAGDNKIRNNEAAPPALLGQGRARDIVINVVLPLAAARGIYTDDRLMTETAAGLYERYPARPGNTIERHMQRQLGLDRVLLNSARRLQGLLHIYRNFCLRGGCLSCPFRVEDLPDLFGFIDNSRVREGCLSGGSR